MASRPGRGPRRGIDPTDLTTTSYAILGLLALRPWTTYELAQQMQRSLRNFWPRAESKIYEEPKKLVARGLARRRRERTGRRPRTVYSITPKGRAALRRWLDEPGAPAQLEFEGILKVFFGDQGTKEQLLANIRAIRAQEEENMRIGLAIVSEYPITGGPFPERLHILGLMIGFLHEHSMSIYRWARWAEREVVTWPGVRREDRPRVAREVFERAVKEMREHVGGDRDDRDRGSAREGLGDRQRRERPSAPRRKRRGQDD